MYRKVPRLLLVAGALLGTFVGCWAIWRPFDQRRPEGWTLATADYYSRLGNWDKAGPIFARLEQTYRDSGDKRNELYAHVSRFGSEAESMNLQNASNELRTILLKPDVQRDLALKQRCLEMKAYVDLNLDGLSARPSLEELVRIAKMRGDRQAESHASGNLGILAFLEGKPSEAKSRVAGAIARSFFYHDVAAQIRYLSLMGQGAVETHGSAQALWLFNRAIGIARSNPDTGFPKLATSGKASALTQLGRFAESKQVIDDGLEYARVHGNIGFEVEMLAQAGQLAEKQNRVPEAIELYQNAATRADRIHFNRGVAEVNAQLAALYQRAGNLAEAEKCEQRSISAHRRIGEVYELPHHLAVEASLQEELGQREAAENTYLIAERIVSTMLRNSPTAGLKKSVLAAMSEVYLGHFRLAAHEKDFPKAYNVIEEIRGRVAADRLRATGADHRPPPAVAAAERSLALLQMQLLDTSNPRQRQRISDALTESEQETTFDEESTFSTYLRQRPTLAEMQRVLAPNEMVLEYVIGDAESFCLVIESSRGRIVHLDGRRKIDDLVNKDVAALRSKQPAADEGRGLFSAIVAPLGEMPDNADLIVIPDGSLYRIPFSALVDTNNRYLIESHTISYAPSSSVLALIRAAQPTKLREMIAVGNVPYSGRGGNSSRWRIFRGLDSLERNTFSPLPATGDEVRTVTATLKDLNGVILSGDKATETNFKREAAKGASVIHLAVHAFTDEVNPDRAGLIFAPGDSNDDGLLQVREIRRLPLAATSLVTLSACDTSAGPVEGEEGVFSIVDAFLDAGARTAVATYWMIEDSSTSELMEIFYTSLSHGQRPAAALRTAQLEMLTRGQETKAPFYWAAFNITGDGSRAIEGVLAHDN